MCGRFGSTFSGKDLENYYDLNEKLEIEIKQNYNIAPSFRVPVITKNSPLTVKIMNWGFIPKWQKPDKAKYKPINARAEKLEEPFYKEAYESNRCLIPASFFYEWQKINIDGKIERVPWLFKLKDNDIFSFAGIYSVHSDAEGVSHYFFAIVTTSANSLMKKIHNRMPVIIDRKDILSWLDGTARSLLKPYEYSKMECFKISDKVNSAGYNKPDIIMPI